jgi:tripartite-type tricarboxylate transporter receptor subunit TctC
MAYADDYPSRPVRLVVGFAPAGPGDICARLIGQWLSDRLSRQFVVENRPGAGSNIATEAVIHAPPDGYTLLLASSSNAINATLYDNLKFNFIRDIVPITSFVRLTDAMLVNPSLPARSVPEFIAYAKANPGKINMATSGKGSPAHLFGELFKVMAGVDLATVAYRGGGAALVDLLAGQVHVMFEGISSSGGYIKAGKLRALGVTSATRLAMLPDTPAVNESVPGYEATSRAGLGAPRGTPVDIIDRLNREANAALADPAMQGRIADLGGAAMPGSPADFAKLIADETEKWGQLIRVANIKPD